MKDSRPSPTPPEPPKQESAAPAKTPKTEEELLDEALIETFPASDPISPGTGTPPRPPAGRTTLRLKKRQV